MPHGAEEKYMRTYPQLRIRLPPDLDEWLEQQAQTNRRSKSSEVAYRLQEARKASEIPAAGQASQA